MSLLSPSKILVTGAAGFIGFHVTKRLLDEGFQVVGIDNLNDYYSVQLKRDRIAQLDGREGFWFLKVDLSEANVLEEIFKAHSFQGAIHLGAQAGVRYSIDHPSTYIQSNLVGTANLLELARQHSLGHFVYASSSSVYGMNRKMPFSEDDSVDHPISLYAATKKSNELMAHSYSHLFGLPTTGLRFFTVYGPWGRPDMATFKFTQSILAGKPIDVYNHGQMRRDFTYVDDIVSGVVAALKTPATPNPDWDATQPDASSSSAPYRIYNIGNHQSVELSRFIEVLEDALGTKAILNMMPLQPGDVLETYADVSRLEAATGYSPSTPIEVGLPKFVEWYRSYFNV
ncbi:hypothetical protein ABT09_00575 [bacterium SCN 57-13]|nr:NAD-dependent epimerase [Armatimonadota bacterium]ODU53990.1 MAG: hypothetical protein ABT09_00575 [bacterium SCN 57-13]